MGIADGEHQAKARAMSYGRVAGRILAVWLLTVAILLALSLADAFVLHRARGISDLYLFQQDMPLLLGEALVVVLLAFTRPTPAARSWTPPRGWPWILGLTLGACALAGTWFVFDGYDMTVDEFMANFDAKIFAAGHLLARVPEAWRPYAGALQPLFAFETPRHAFWSSTYLPVNAAIRALAGLAGAASLVNPAWTAVSVICVAGIARRLWPDRPQAAWIAAILLATSSQLLVAGMTAYAMPAHLALNLIWLWCFLRGGKAGHTAALAAGFLATGLHQLVFHPLFAAPFVLQLWTERRWRAAALYTGAYAAIGLFWILYFSLALQLSGGAGDAGGSGGAAWFGQRVLWLLEQFDPVRITAMAKDLLRFVVWQNPLTAPLAVLAVIPALRTGGALRSLALGVGLTLAAVFVLLPWQDHGWGYRYLHGVLGSVCLLAAWGWGELTARMAPDDQAVGAAAFAVVAAGSALLFMPFCVWRAGDYVRPYAHANAAIHRTDADLVLVDGTGGWYLEALVRNDPDLAGRPLVLELDRLDPAQVETLCATRSVAVFDRADAARFGIRTLPGGRNKGPLRRLMGERNCGTIPIGSAAP